MEKTQVAVIGGGAAGLTAAISAARSGARVLVLEAAKRVGQKILKTGNGRCNLSNMRILPSDYNDPGFVERIITTHAPEKILEFFGSIGLLTTIEDEGRVYPLSNTASSVLDVLRDACARLDVEIVCERDVIDIQRGDEGYVLKCADDVEYAADRVVVSTGGATRLLECLGHRIVPFRPVLCPMKTESKDLKGLSGVRARVNVCATHAGEAVPFFEQRGEVLFRDYGLSGIVIFDLSRVANEGDIVHLDFLPGRSAEELFDWLNRRYALIRICTSQQTEARLSYEDLMSGTFHARVSNALIRKAGLKPSMEVDSDELAGIARIAKDFTLRLGGPGDVKQAQVTRGGAAVDEFDERTLESSLAPGVFAAGEAMNIDGRCGGFNLHWAWSSGLVSGENAAHSSRA